MCLTRTLPLAITLGALLVPPAAIAQVQWVDEPDVRSRLATGEVVMRSSVEHYESHGEVDVAVLVHAPRETVWKVLIDCAHAASFIPGLKRCHRLSGAPDGSWELIEHELKYSWYMPTIHTVFRTEMHPPTRIDFKRVSGDLKEERGDWILVAAPESHGTIVTHHVFVEPGYWIPQAFIRHSLRKDLPAALNALRVRAEGIAHEGAPTSVQ